jgi:hypothetical protein
MLDTQRGSKRMTPAALGQRSSDLAQRARSSSFGEDLAQFGGEGIGAPTLDTTAKESLVAWAVEHCPVTDTIARAVPLSIEASP